MKWIAFAGFLGLIPLLVMWMQSRPRDTVYVYGLLGLLPFIAPAFHFIIAPYGWPNWSGYSRGFELSLIDSFAVALLIARPPKWGRLPFLGIWLLFLLANLISAMVSTVYVASLFASWQVVRMIILFAAVASVAADPRAPRAFLTGMIIGIAINAGVAIEQRFLSGMVQAPGLFVHQNVAGMATHFVTFTIFASLMNRRPRVIDVIGLMSVAIVVLLGASRAVIGLAVVGVGAVILISLIRYAKPRTMGIAALGCVLLAGAYPIAMASLDSRFEQGKGTVRGLTYDEERLAFERAAKAIWSDHPMGVGANMYVTVANTGGYSEQSGVIWNFGSRSAHVHNGYLLAGAEMGYLGFIAFLGLFVWPVFYALRIALRNRRDSRADIVLGIGAGIFVVALHSAVEWVFFTTTVQWLYAINLGLMVGIATQIKHSQSMARSQARAMAMARREQQDRQEPQQPLPA